MTAHFGGSGYPAVSRTAAAHCWPIENHGHGQGLPPI